MAENGAGGREWASIAEAAREENIPLRTLYRWRKTNAIASKVEDGVTLVRLADVRARAGHGQAEATAQANTGLAATATVGTSAGVPAGAPAMAGKVATVATAPGPELIARLFRLFNEGTALEVIVQREQLLPQTVLDAHHAFENLLAAGGRPSLQDRMAAHEKETARRLGERDGYFNGVASELQFHEQRLSEAENQIGVLDGKLQAAALEQLWTRLQVLEERVNYIISHWPAA